VWDLNNIRNLRFTETQGLPPKTEAPHVTLLDSFSSPDRMAEAARRFREAAAEIEPFEVSLKGLKYFTHGQKRGFTIYVEPEIEHNSLGQNPLNELQRKLYGACVEGNFTMLEDAYRPSKFVPHVSLGKISTREELDQALEKYGKSWQEIKFKVTQFQIMSKLVHDTVVRYVIPLGKVPITEIDFDQVPFPTDGTYSINVNWVPPETTDADLLAAFPNTGALKAQVVFKTIDRKSYTKGWGNVSFPSKKIRDEVLQKNWSVNRQRLEIFPCD